MCFNAVLFYVSICGKRNAAFKVVNGTFQNGINGFFLMGMVLDSIVSRTA